MAQIIDIPNVGQVEFPDAMSEADVSIAAKRLHDESIQPQVPANIPVASAYQLPPPEQVKLPSGEQALKEQSDRFQQALLSGALALPIGLIKTPSELIKQTPVTQELQRAGISPLTLESAFVPSLPKPLQDVYQFEPRDLSEIAIQFAGSFVAPEVMVGPAKAFAKANQQIPQLRESVKILQNERSALLKKLKTQRSLQTDITSTSDQLHDNLIKQQNIKDIVEASQIPAVDKVDFARTFGSKSTPEMIHERALERVKDLDIFAEQGLIEKDRVPFLRQAVYDETLKANGIKVRSEKLSKYNILGELFRWGEVQRKTGVATGETAQNLVIKKTLGQNYINEQTGIIAQASQAANKVGVSLEDLQYFRTQADGSIRFDPSALEIPGKVSIPATLKQFNPQQQEILSGIRKYLDITADDIGIPKLPGYIPLREKPQFINVSTKTSAEAIQNPALTKARTSGVFDPTIHETDFQTVMGRYIREASKTKFTGPALEDGIKNLQQLQLSGLVNEAGAFKKYLLDTLNINGEKEASQIFGTYKLDQIKPQLDAFVKMLPEPESAGRQIYDAVQRAMYTNLIGIKPKAWIKQWLQAPVMGSIELGPKWWASGASDLLISKQRRNNANKILKASLLDDVGQLEEQIASTPTNKVAKIIDIINAPGAVIAKRTMGRGERANRLQTILGAQNKFEAAWSQGREQAIDLLLKESALTTAQRSLISRAFISGGMENARDIYSLIITQRVNFTYNIADKPEILRSTLGNLFPFTTYARNVLARTAEAYVEGKPIYIIKQVAYPLATLLAMEAVFERALPSGSMPIESIEDLVTRGITPTPAIVLQSPIQTLTPLPRGLIQPSLKKPIDIEKAKKAIGRDLEVFPEIKDSPNKLYKEIGKILKK